MKPILVNNNQLKSGTYCKFATPQECKLAFERAKELGLRTYYIGYCYGETILYVYSKNEIVSCFEPHNLDYEFEGYTPIPTTEFLARMEGTWESTHAKNETVDYKALYEAQTRAIEEAVAEIEARAIKLSKGGTLYEEDKAKGLDEAKEILNNKLK